MVSTVLEICGLTCLTVAAFLLAIPAGFAIAGASLLFAAFALDKRDIK